MPDLNECIQTWRDRLERTGSLDPAMLDELEDHLRQTLAEIPTDGLSNQERVMMAAHRLGASEALADPFRADRPLASKALPQRFELRFEPLWCTSTVGYWWWHRWGKHWWEKYRAGNSR